MSLVLTGRNEARLDETAHQIRRAAPAVKDETVAADLSSASGISALVDHVGDRPVEQRGDLVLLRLDPPAPARLLQVGRDGNDGIERLRARPGSSATAERVGRPLAGGPPPGIHR
jgi:hypothetical protein